MPIVSEADPESSSQRAEITPAQPARPVHGGPTFVTIVLGTTVGAFIGTWLFALTFWWIASRWGAIVDLFDRPFFE